ncbi:MAG: hydrogenase maturation nickel metallochaperone HypA [Calditrichaeota bacterium]|nr:MAG: hydrogenase maturation nickel metallochaperone HypA [Calditrichota bacterium]
MHELSIASSIIDSVTKEVKKHDVRSVYEIKLRIGELTAVVPDSLRFGFESLVKDTFLEHTQLTIETSKIEGECIDCKRGFTVENFNFICPHCSSKQVDIISGNELEILSIEIEK